MLSDLLAHGHDIRAVNPPRGPMPLHCMAASVGYEQRKNEVYAWDGAKRGTSPFLVIQHTTVGEGRLDYAGSHYRLVAGQTMLVTVPHAHRYWLERGGHWEYFWAILHGREAMRLARDILDHAGPVLALDAELADRLAAACLGLLTLAHPSPGQISTLAYGAMTALHDGVFGLRGADMPAHAPLPPALQRVADFVEGNLGAALPVDRLAAVAGISRAHFVRQFSAAFGLPPSDFVLSRRLERIERLLLATEMKVTDIAAATGFADANYLAKAFRRKRGLSPLDFRATRQEAT